MRSPQNWCLHSEFLIQCFRTDPRVKLRDSSVVRSQNPGHRPAHDQHTILLGGIRAVTPDHGVGDGIGTVEMVQCRQTPPGALHTIDRHAVRTVVLGPGWDLGLEIMGKRHIRRKFRSQTSDNMDRWKAEQGRGREKRKIRRKKSRRERVRRKKIQMREKVGKSRNMVFFQWFGAPEGRKVGSLKRRVRSQLARWEMKNCTPFICKSKCAKHLGLGALLEVEMSKKCTPLWREAHFQVKMYKHTPRSDHFCKLRCRKSARRCGAKHISKSKCTKNTTFGPLLKVAMSKKCTPLWHAAHFQVKMCKTHHVRTIFGGSDVEKVHAVVARSTFPSQNVQSTPCTDHFWRFRSCFAWQAQGIVDLVKSDQNVRVLYHFQLQPPLHYTTTTPSLHSTTLHYTTLHCTQLHSITLNYTTLHYTPLHYITLRYTTLHYTTLHSTTLHYLPLHYLPLHFTTLHYSTLNYTTTTPTTTLHDTKLHYTTQHYTTFHDTPLHYTTLHWMTLHHR